MGQVMTPARMLVFIPFLLSASGCGEVHLAAVDGAFAVDHDRIGFGTVWLGARSERAVRVSNSTRVEQTLSISVPDGYEAPETVALPAGGVVRVEVAFAPAEERAYPGDLVIAGEGAERRIPLEGTGRAALSCPAETACRSYAFAPAHGTCEPVAAPDGLACEDACTTDGVCQAGECVGASRSCDDHDACTFDACGPEGCVHTERSCAQPYDPCQVAACDPRSGCTTVAAADGTACGRAGCLVADVCLGGVCVERDVPEGAPCGAPSPCQGPGVCHDRVCVRVPGERLQPEWTVWGGGASFGPLSRHEQVAFDEEGNAFFFWRESRGANTSWLTSVSASGSERWQIPLSLQQWDAPERVAVAGDTILVATWMGDVEALQRLTGAHLWHASLAPAVSSMLSPGYTDPPQLKVVAFLPGPNGQIRVLVLASPRGWAPWSPGPGSDAFVVELDGSTGAPVRTVRVGDEVSVAAEWDSEGQIDVAPSVAVDEHGDLYLALRAPENSLVAFDHNLVERWRREGLNYVFAAVSGKVLALTDDTWELAIIDGQSGAVTAKLGTGIPVEHARALVASADAVEFDDVPADGSRSDVGWVKWNLLDGTRQWRVSLGSQAFVHTALRTGQGTTLLIVSGPPSWTRELVEISPDGEINFRCPGPSGPDSGVGLHDGTWIEFRDGTNPYVVGYSIVPRSPATEGWVVPSGNLARTRSTP